MRFYPKAGLYGKSFHDQAAQQSRSTVIKTVGVTALLLNLLFLGLFAYIFGAIYQQNSHIHNFNVLFVDYDGGLIGTSFRQAYQYLQGAGFPTIIEEPVSQHPQPAVLDSAVCHTQYWAALYISPNATARLAAGLRAIMQPHRIIAAMLLP